MTHKVYELGPAPALLSSLLLFAWKPKLVVICALPMRMKKSVDNPVASSMVGHALPVNETDGALGAECVLL